VPGTPVENVQAAVRFVREYPAATEGLKL
jgi:hypothetical protein